MDAVAYQCQIIPYQNPIHFSLSVAVGVDSQRFLILRITGSVSDCPSLRCVCLPSGNCIMFDLSKLSYC